MPHILEIFCLLTALVPGEVVEISRDTILDPKTTYGSLVIKASGITIDGRGATIRGAIDGNPRDYRGKGIVAENVNNVRLKNVKVKGFETGLHIKNAVDWTVEGCDFSDNFHDPGFGWGENGQRGGILLEGCSRISLRKNQAHRVWDACTLVDCEEVSVVENDFSHTSNTCLKLWHSSRNVVERNNLSYGLRINPGEVHARDSTGVLIESGSDDNRFTGNDVTHGGDGIFIRVLNGWVSKRNTFTGNDTSYANNNGFEAWSPENIYINNKANHCSYGFWLGASDKTVLEGNEASFNGRADGFHNSPHLPGKSHAGIVFMFGPSSHTIARKNRCEGNQGAGIALIGDPVKFKAYHWILEGNHLIGNRWGIYACHADWLTLNQNRFAENQEADFSRDTTVTRIIELSVPAEQPEERARPVRVRVDGPSIVRVGETAVYRPVVDGSEPGILHWLGVGEREPILPGASERVFQTPGFERIGLTSSARGQSTLAWKDVYVLDPFDEIDTPAPSWSWVDPGSRVTFEDDARHVLVGSRSTRAVVEPYSGGRVSLTFRLTSPVSLKPSAALIFWIRTRNANIPGWQGPNPLVGISGGSKRLELIPEVDRLAQPAQIEAREGWTRFEVPLEPAKGWKRQGHTPDKIDQLSFGFDSWGGDPLTIWIDGIMIR